jgi:hypothetical protein
VDPRVILACGVLVPSVRRQAALGALASKMGMVPYFSSLLQPLGAGAALREYSNAISHASMPRARDLLLVRGGTVG